MSTETCIAYFGLRFAVDSEEIESIELRTDWRVKAARRNGLKYYWGNFGGLQNSYLLFVGTQLGIMGLENAEFINISSDDLRDTIYRTSVKLLEAGFKETPSFHLQWQPA